jgi:DNA-binding winged helix-turn-helix (wHTH) protein
MKVATGKVIAGKVVVDGDAFAEGSEVTVIAGDDHEQFAASPEEEVALLAALAEIEAGQVVSAADLLDRLRRIA